MPLESPPAPLLRAAEVVFSPGTPGGALAVNPAFAELFARLGLTTAAGFLELPGEVVSGHPDRHVVRVELPGAPRAFYLKRQHVVGWREKCRNWRAGFGWVSRCEREAVLLRQLGRAELAAPRWAAAGALGRRAFLLVEEVPGAVELRRLLSAHRLSPAERRRLADRVGAALGAVHAAGFATPDMSAKHVLVNPDTLAVTFIDWQSATRGAKVPKAQRADALGALHASLAQGLASHAERLRALGKTAGINPAARKTVPLVLRAAEHHAKRRSVREQLQPLESSEQRLVWVAGEAVCAIPDVAAVWPRPAVAPPFYGTDAINDARGSIAGYDAVLIRGRSFAPLGRFRAWVRATPWRAPGVTLGRVLFHLARHGVPAPRLLAFGQRFTSATRAEWFALYEAPPGAPLRGWRLTASATERGRIRTAVTECANRLHSAGCALDCPELAFAVAGSRVMVADPRAVRLVRRVTDARRRRDLRAIARLLDVE